MPGPPREYAPRRKPRKVSAPVTEPETTPLEPTASTEATVFQEQAVQLVIGPGWTYVELVTMPTWRKTVDQVAEALAEAHRSGILAGRSVLPKEPST